MSHAPGDEFPAVPGPVSIEQYEQAHRGREKEYLDRLRRRCEELKLERMAEAASAARSRGQK